MEWNIVPFIGMGPVKFGMSPSEVSEILGAPEDTDSGDNDLTEYRAIDMPIIRYKDNKVTQIEAFYDVKNVTLGDVNIFGDDGLQIMQTLETKNGGAKIDVGITIFENLGITAGRLDEDVPGEHSVTAFCKGYWDNDMEDFTDISFQ